MCQYILGGLAILIPALVGGFGLAAIRKRGHLNEAKRDLKILLKRTRVWWIGLKYRIFTRTIEILEQIINRYDRNN